MDYETKKCGSYEYKIYDDSVLETDNKETQMYFKCIDCGDVTHRDDTRIAYGDGRCPICQSEKEMNEQDDF